MATDCFDRGVNPPVAEAVSSHGTHSVVYAPYCPPEPFHIVAKHSGHLNYLHFGTFLPNFTALQILSNGLQQFRLTVSRR